MSLNKVSLILLQILCISSVYLHYDFYYDVDIMCDVVGIENDDM